MKTRNEKLHLSVLSLAVQGALAVMFAVPTIAHAADDEVTVLTQPTSTIEVGAGYLSQQSAKFGEYTGLNKDGGVIIGNLNIRGGGAYDSGNTLRWGVSGSDLGTSSRSLEGSVGNQGTWEVNVGYDELRHNLSDSYATPLQGGMGGNNFTLPTSFGTINANNATPSARVLTAPQLGAFHTEEVGTTRKNTSFGAGYNFNRQWSLRFDYNHLDQSGSKLIGTGSQGGISLVGGSTGRAEGNNIIMNPTNYTTDTFNLAVHWVGEQAHLTGGYYGSIFRDGYDSLSWQNALASGASACVGAACYVNNTMSTAPDNQFHQLNLSGGYAFSASTKIAGGLSYGYNRQNDTYAPTSIMQPSGTAYNMMQAGGLPQTSLDGAVITTHADLKLTNQTTKNLLLSAGVKYNERDNRTSSNAYLYNNLGNAAYTGINTPYSNRKAEFELAGDYRISKTQSLRLAYDHDYIKRWCNNVADGAPCVASPSSNDDKLGLTYRLKASDSTKLNVGYAFAKRNANLDQSYLSNAGNRLAPASGVLNGGDFLGYVAYPYASRTQHILKAGVNWQATERLDFGLSGRYSYDNYDATLGVQDGHTASVNLDATYAYAEQSSVSAYATWQNSERELQNASGSPYAGMPAPATQWTNQLKQSDYTLGLNTKHGGLLGGKLELLGDLTYSFGKSAYSTQVPYLATCAAANTLSCGDTPDIKATLVAFRLSGTYLVDKHSKIGLFYLYQHLTSNDYYYNGLQYGATPNRVMPTFEQAPSYSQNMAGVSYLYSFR